MTYPRETQEQEPSFRSQLRLILQQHLQPGGISASEPEQSKDVLAARSLLACAPAPDGSRVSSEPVSELAPRNARDVFESLEAYAEVFRKLRMRSPVGRLVLGHVDYRPLETEPGGRFVPTGWPFANSI